MLWCVLSQTTQVDLTITQVDYEIGVSTGTSLRQTRMYLLESAVCCHPHCEHVCDDVSATM